MSCLVSLWKLDFAVSILLPTLFTPSSQFTHSPASENQHLPSSEPNCETADFNSLHYTPSSFFPAPIFPEILQAPMFFSLFPTAPRRVSEVFIYIEYEGLICVRIIFFCLSHLILIPLPRVLCSKRYLHLQLKRRAPMKGFLVSASSRPRPPRQPQRGRGSFLPLGDPCSSVLRSSIHWALCFGLSRVTVPLYSSWSSSLHPERETPYNYERPESVIEPQNHKCLWFVANSKSCVQPQMVSHELGFISPWSGHIPGDPR